MAQIKNKSVEILLNFSSWRQILPINYFVLFSSQGHDNSLKEKYAFWSLAGSIFMESCGCSLPHIGHNMPTSESKSFSLFKPKKDKVYLVLPPFTWHMKNYLLFNPPLLTWKVSLWGILLCGYFSEKVRNPNKNKINS